MNNLLFLPITLTLIDLARCLEVLEAVSCVGGLNLVEFWTLLLQLCGDTPPRLKH